MPMSTPGARWPLWSEPLGTSLLWVTTSREASPGPQAVNTAELSSKRLAVRPVSQWTLVRRLLQFIRIGRRNRDPAFAQQPRQQAHRHPDDVVVGPADRSDQAPALALYSVGTRLILRFTASYVRVDLARRKFTHSDMRPRNAPRSSPGAPIDHMDPGVDLVGLARQCAQEGGGLRAVLWLSEDPAMQDDLGVGGHDDTTRRLRRDRLRLRSRRPGDEAQRPQRHGRPLIDARCDGAKRDARPRQDVDASRRGRRQQNDQRASWIIRSTRAGAMPQPIDRAGPTHRNADRVRSGAGGAAWRSTSGASCSAASKAAASKPSASPAWRAAITVRVAAAKVIDAGQLERASTTSRDHREEADGTSSMRTTATSIRSSTAASAPRPRASRALTASSRSAATKPSRTTSRPLVSGSNQVSAARATSSSAPTAAIHWKRTSPATLTEASVTITTSAVVGRTSTRSVAARAAKSISARPAASATTCTRALHEGAAKGGSTEVIARAPAASQAARSPRRSRVVATAINP